MLRRFRCVIAEIPLLGREPAPAEPEKREKITKQYQIRILKRPCCSIPEIKELFHLRST